MKTVFFNTPTRNGCLCVAMLPTSISKAMAQPAPTTADFDTSINGAQK